MAMAEYEGLNALSDPIKYQISKPSIEEPNFSRPNAPPYNRIIAKSELSGLMALSNPIIYDAPRIENEFF
jgi:hypothetical protein